MAGGPAGHSRCTRCPTFFRLRLTLKIAGLGCLVKLEVLSEGNTSFGLDDLQSPQVTAAAGCAESSLSSKHFAAWPVKSPLNPLKPPSRPQRVAPSILVQLHMQVKAGKGHTAAAKAGLKAVQATEARWDWIPLDAPSHPSSAADISLGSTPSELQELIVTNRLVGSQHVFPITQAGVPRQAAEVVSEWQDALAYCQHMAAGKPN